MLELMSIFMARAFLLLVSSPQKITISETKTPLLHCIVDSATTVDNAAATNARKVDSIIIQYALSVVSDFLTSVIIIIESAGAAYPHGIVLNKIGTQHLRRRWLISCWQYQRCRD